MTDDDFIITQLAELQRGRPAMVVLKTGQRCLVYDVAWGRDRGETYHHLTTNISPGRDRAEVDFFTTDQIQFIEIGGRRIYAASDNH